MEPTRPPTPPARGPTPPRLTTAEEETAAINADYPALLANVHGKGAPRRFLEPVRERPHRSDEHTFTEGELDAFMRSLDAHLYPSSFTADPGMRRIWHHFWDARTASLLAVSRRMIDETFAKHGRRIDPQANIAELHATERAVTRALLRQDRARLRSLIGRRGVELSDLAIALWVSHAEGWYTLATAPVLLPALTSLTGGQTYQDGFQLRAPSVHGSFDRRRAPEKRATSGMKPYQALSSHKIVE